MGVRVEGGRMADVGGGWLWGEDGGGGEWDPVGKDGGGPMTDCG